ncbi:MAG: glycosyltransferase, partial [Chloroflexota bacterium]
MAVSCVGGERLRRSWWPFRHKISAIQNGVDAAAVSAAGAGPEPAEFRRVDGNSGLNIGFVGSLDEDRKGLDVLLHAFAALTAEPNGVTCRLWLVGSGNDEAKLRRDAERLGIAERTHFVGEQHNPHVWMRVMDVFVLPSRREGLPNALLEAMALGRCCIASDCPTGPAELIEPGRD